MDISSGVVHVARSNEGQLLAVPTTDLSPENPGTEPRPRNAADGATRATVRSGYPAGYLRQLTAVTKAASAAEESLMTVRAQTRIGDGAALSPLPCPMRGQR